MEERPRRRAVAMASPCPARGRHHPCTARERQGALAVLRRASAVLALDDTAPYDIDVRGLADYADVLIDDLAANAAITPERLRPRLVVGSNSPQDSTHDHVQLRGSHLVNAERSTVAPTPSVGAVFRPQFAPERLAAAAAAADAAGLDELWLWEDCFRPAGSLTASIALANSRRLKVGVGVLPVPMRNVALTAMEIATLARAYPGRIRIGVGHGVQDWMAQIGEKVASPMTLLREYVTVLLALLRGERVTFVGRYIQLDRRLPRLAARPGHRTPFGRRRSADAGAQRRTRLGDSDHCGYVSRWPA